jgi:dephospho-CoA kinase
VTGGFGAGKSTVAGFFKRRGARVFDADKIAHEALMPGSPTYARIARVFGSGILRKNKEVDRNKLAKVVFESGALLKKLNDIVHPYVVKRIKSGIKNVKRGGPEAVIVLDVPLLIEAGLQGMVDKVIVVKAGLGQQVERCRRSCNLSRDEVLARISSQMPVREKIRFADFVIDNTKSKERTRREVKKIWERIRPRTIRKKRT